MGYFTTLIHLQHIASQRPGNIIRKGKKYLKAWQKPPANVKVMKGPRDGIYYLTEDVHTGRDGGNLESGGAKTRSQIISEKLKEERESRGDNKKSENIFRSAFEDVKGDKSHAKIYELREKLGWTREKFDAVLMKLRDERKIQLVYGETNKMTKEQLKNSFIEDGIKYIALFYI